jgi:hypothetical protein
MSESVNLLPPQFADLEPFAPRWCLATERERFAQRIAGPMESLQEFYDAFFPRAEEAMTYLDHYPLDELPEDALHLLQLLYSLIMVSFPVEAWRQPNVPDSGAAYLDLLIEPIP